MNEWISIFLIKDTILVRHFKGNLSFSIRSTGLKKIFFNAFEVNKKVFVFVCLFLPIKEIHHLQILGKQQFDTFLWLIRSQHPLFFLMLSKFTRDVQPSLDPCFSWYLFVLHLSLNYQAPNSLLSFICPSAEKKKEICQYILTFIFWGKLLTCPLVFLL